MKDNWIIATGWHLTFWRQAPKRCVGRLKAAEQRDKPRSV